MASYIVLTPSIKPGNVKKFLKMKEKPPSNGEEGRVQTFDWCCYRPPSPLSLAMQKISFRLRCSVSVSVNKGVTPSPWVTWNGLTRGLRTCRDASSLAGFMCSSQQTFPHISVVTALCLIETSSLRWGQRKDTHTWGMGVDVFSPRALCLFASVYLFPHLFWVSAFNCFAVLWQRDTVALLEHKGNGLTSTHPQCTDQKWAALLHWSSWSDCNRVSDLVSATWLSLYASVLKY